MGDFRDGRDVENLEAGIADGLADDEPSLRTNSGGEARVIPGTDQGRADVEARQRLHEQVDRAAIERRRGDDVIAGAGEGRDGEVHRRHPARRAERADAAFERGDALFKHRRRRVGDARIEMAGAFEVEERSGVVGIIEDVGRRLIDRHGARAGRRVGALTGVQAQRVEGGRAGGWHDDSLQMRRHGVAHAEPRRIGPHRIDHKRNGSVNASRRYRLISAF